MQPCCKIQYPMKNRSQVSYLFSGINVYVIIDQVFLRAIALRVNDANKKTPL